jgi:cell wall-associated NlpC family hydrolase
MRSSANGRTLAEAAGRHMTQVAIADIKPGNLPLFAMRAQCPAKHCAILVTPDRMAHAIESHPVDEVSLVPWWRNRLRFP